MIDQEDRDRDLIQTNHPLDRQAARMESAKATGLLAYWTPKPKVGRPKKPKPPVLAPPSAPTPGPDVVLADPETSTVKKRPRGHTNWHVGEPKERMDAAVSGWYTHALFHMILLTRHRAELTRL